MMIIPSLCLCIGFFCGYKIGNEQRIVFKTPVKLMREKRQEKEIEHEKDVLNQYIDNIDNYPYNQKSIKE